jgi:hypothetical protein
MASLARYLWWLTVDRHHEALRRNPEAVRMYPSIVITRGDAMDLRLEISSPIFSDLDFACASRSPPHSPASPWIQGWA